MDLLVFPYTTDVTLLKQPCVSVETLYLNSSNEFLGHRQVSVIAKVSG